MSRTPPRPPMLNPPSWRRMFSNDEVRLIRSLRAEGLTLQAIADKFEASYRTIHAIVQYETYRDVP